MIGDLSNKLFSAAFNNAQGLIDFVRVEQFQEKRYDVAASFSDRHIWAMPHQPIYSCCVDGERIETNLNINILNTGDKSWIIFPYVWLNGLFFTLVIMKSPKMIFQSVPAQLHGAFGNLRMAMDRGREAALIWSDTCTESPVPL